MTWSESLKVVKSFDQQWWKEMGLSYCRIIQDVTFHKPSGKMMHLGIKVFPHTFCYQWSLLVGALYMCQQVYIKWGSGWKYFPAIWPQYSSWWKKFIVIINNTVSTLMLLTLHKVVFWAKLWSFNICSSK